MIAMVFPSKRTPSFSDVGELAEIAVLRSNAPLTIRAFSINRHGA